ncbi:hypothetical protein C1645_833515 [Glomus cerebriforme]|uniref:Uncharacterized protein n=1 Tax=Glomus cerebriforme TaxID=658196 RepID=A0A397SDN1_9GLOM|nr:hypothetical protein C1645_833515 [Glomus cerebriforme]
MTNILNAIPRTPTTNIQVLKVNPWFLCEEKFLSNPSDPIKEFIMTSYKQIHYQKFSLELEKNNNKKLGLEEFTKSSADEMNIITTKLTNTTITTVITAKQVDLDQTSVDDQWMDKDEIEVQAHPDISDKKWANEATDSLSSRKSKKYVHPEEFSILKRLIWELSSNITQFSEIKEKRELHKEAI